MSAPAIDLLRRTHALLEEAIRRMDAFETDSARDDSDAATVSESLRTAIDTLESIAGRVLMRTPVEPPRLSAECADKGEADLEDVEARTEALLPPADVVRSGWKQFSENRVPHFWEHTPEKDGTHLLRPACRDSGRGPSGLSLGLTGPFPPDHPVWPRRKDTRAGDCKQCVRALAKKGGAR